MGKELVTLGSDGKQSIVPTTSLEGKHVGLYFSAHWCERCSQFRSSVSGLPSQQCAALTGARYDARRDSASARARTCTHERRLYCSGQTRFFQELQFSTDRVSERRESRELFRPVDLKPRAATPWPL